jgi:hypothetical protein
VTPDCRPNCETVSVWASYPGRDGSRFVCGDTVTGRDELRQLDALVGTALAGMYTLMSSLLSKLAQAVKLSSCIRDTDSPDYWYSWFSSGNCQDSIF